MGFHAIEQECQDGIRHGKDGRLRRKDVPQVGMDLCALHCLSLGPGRKKSLVLQFVGVLVSIHSPIISTLSQIDWSRRKIRDTGNDCLVTVDGTDFKIQELGAAFSSQKYAKKSALRYEVALCIKTGEIVWVMGPFPPGDWNDLMIFRYALKEMLDPNERVEADDGYVGEDPSTAKVPGSMVHDQDPKLLYVRSKVRQRHETANKRFKDWGILKKRFEHDLELHGPCVKAIIVLTQLEIENGLPLFDVPYNDDASKLPPASQRPRMQRN